jgi:hypothetical protein
MDIGCGGGFVGSDRTGIKRKLLTLSLIVRILGK